VLRIEAGHENPTWRVLDRIADALGLTIAELAVRAESEGRRPQG
jgi:transcriptional regulator with XRE-family HTH domain